MTTDVFHKLITLSCGFDLLPETERAGMIDTVAKTVLQSVALRATQSLPIDQMTEIMHKLQLITPENRLETMTTQFPDLDIWIQEEVREIAGQIDHIV